MSASTPPSPRRTGSNDAEASSDEVRMRLALEKLGTRSTPPVRSRPGSATGAGHSTQRTRHKFAREGEVPVERMPSPVRSPADLQRELTEERAARQRAEQALATAQATVSTQQVALSRSEQAERASREAVEEREAAMDGLRAELRRAAAELEAVLADKPPTRAERGGRRAGTARGKRKQVQDTPGVAGPQPARWWLPLLQRNG